MAKFRLLETCIPLPNQPRLCRASKMMALMALRPDEQAVRQQSPEKKPLDIFSRTETVKEDASNDAEEKAPTNAKEEQWPKWVQQIGKRRRSLMSAVDRAVQGNGAGGDSVGGVSCATDEKSCRETNSDMNTGTTNKKGNNVLQTLADDFTGKGDQKILRAIGRTATVNAAVLVTAATGGAAGAVGFITGGAITAKRLGDGVINDDEKEVAKSLAVYSCATGASVVGQAVTGALMLGVAGASLPLAGAVAFGVGCCSGITAGALSEWTVDSVMDADGKKKDDENDESSNEKEDSIEMVEMVDMSSRKGKESLDMQDPSTLRSLMHM